MINAIIQQFSDFCPLRIVPASDPVRQRNGQHDNRAERRYQDKARHIRPVFRHVGLVIEKVREEGMTDGLQWYCEKCNHKIYEEYFFLDNIITQMQPVFERYYASEEARTCENCGHIQPGKA